MSAPIVTRPPATAVETTPQQPAIDWATYARYGLIAAVVLGAAGLIASIVINYNEKSRETKVRSQWDEVYKGLKEKKKIDERIAAFEGIAGNEKVKGTTAHAYSLMQLAGQHFDMAQNVKKAPEERAAAIERAITLYEFVSKTEPFKSNPSFGPFAARNLALAYEQAQTDAAGTTYFDKAIDALSESLYQGKGETAAPVAAMQSHYLFDPMRAQLGRLYWLRAQRKDAAAGKDDLDKARLYINKSLETPPSTEEKDFMRYAQYRTGKGTAAWRSEATFLKSLLDTPGKLLPDGKAPAMKEEAKPAEKKDAEKTPVAPKADAPKTDAPKTDAPKSDKPGAAKEEPKKTGNASRRHLPILAGFAETIDAVPEVKVAEVPAIEEAAAPVPHISFAHMQKLLKEGNAALCLCIRCDVDPVTMGAKLVE